MAEVTRQQIEEILNNIENPYQVGSLVATKIVKDIEISKGRVVIQIELGYPAAGFKDLLEQKVREKIIAETGVGNVDVTVGWNIVSRSVQKSLRPIDNVKNIIAVASGKGGVGKSTTTANLALALAYDGATVGVLDADIYGPSMPQMFGISGQPESTDEKTVEPMENYGVQVMSIGFFIEEDTPMIWRGPMVTQALEQLLQDTQWKEIDYLLIDLPPGTGDIQLTLSQKIPVSGAIIVTTPQDIALLDARKGLKMFEKVEVPVLGVVENMSTHICSNCGHEEHIFGAGGGAAMAKESNVDLLGSLPLDIQIREQADSGKPTVFANPDSDISAAYMEIARQAAAKLASQAKDYASKFPKIVIQHD